MIMRIFSLKDSKMNLFMNPMFFTSRGQAIRVVTDEVNRPVGPNGDAATTLQVHPEDVDLYEIGEFDTEGGVISAPKEPVLVAKCKDLAIGRQ